MSEEQLDVMYDIAYQRRVVKLLAKNLQFSMSYGPLLKDEFFETQPLRVVFNAVIEYVNLHDSEVDDAVMMAKLTDLCNSRGYSADQANEVMLEYKAVAKLSVRDEKAVIGQFIKFVRRQKMKGALLQSVEVLEKDGDYEAVIKLVDDAVSVGSGVDDGMTDEDLEGLPELYDKLFSREMLVQTGFPSYDQCLNGGMAPGELHMIQAAPKAGKSSTAVCIGAHNCGEGKNVFHVSGELTKEAIAMKYGMAMTGMSERDIMTPDGRKSYKKKIRRLREASEYNLFINHWPEGSANILQVRSWISRIRAKQGIKPDLIIIDYDDCFIPVNGKTDSMYEDSGAVYSDMLALAAYFKCPILTLAQPQREAWELPNEGKLIAFNHLAHSARKAHKCFSLSSLNFPDGSETGVLYVDIVRRGESKVKVRIEKDLARNAVWELT